MKKNMQQLCKYRLSSDEMSKIIGGAQYLGATVYDGPMGCGDDYVYWEAGRVGVWLSDDLIEQPCGYANVLNPSNDQNSFSANANNSTGFDNPLPPVFNTKNGKIFQVDFGNLGHVNIRPVASPPFRNISTSIINSVSSNINSLNSDSD